MSEFKAQILGVLIVITLFGLMHNKITSVFEKVWQEIENKIATQLSE
jgi:hypothetical protein